MANGSSYGYSGSQLPNMAGPLHRKTCCNSCGCNSCESSTGVCPDCGCVEDAVQAFASNLGNLALQYASILQSCGNPATQDFGYGTNFLCPLTPTLCRTCAATNEVAVIFSNDRVFFFTEDPVAMTYSALFDVDARLTFDPTTNEYTFQTCNGQSVWFNPQGTFVAWQSGDDQVDAALDENGLISTLSRTVAGVLDQLVFDRDPDSGRVTEITWQQTASPPVNIRQLQLSFYAAGDSHGNDGDLMAATVLAWDDTTSAFQPLETSCFRYYQGGDGGFQHAMKYVVGPAAFQRMVDAGIDPTDPATTDPTIGLYAEKCFTYDETSHRALTSVLDGLFLYCYCYTPSPLGPSTAYTDWQLKTEEKRPDGSVRLVYSNYLNQVLLTKLTDASGLSWINYFQLGDRGLVLMEAKPSAVANFDDTHADLFPSWTGGGLLLLTSYYTSTGGEGVLDQVYQTHVQEGYGGPQTLQTQFGYTIRLTGTGYWYPRISEIVYPYATPSSPGTAVETDYSYGWYPSSTQAMTQATAVPKVSTSQNGGGDGPTDTQYYRNQYFDELGNLLATQDERGYIDTFVVDQASGARTQMVEDDNPPAGLGWSRPAGAPAAMQLTSNYTIDLLGRTTLSLGPPHTIDLGGTATSIRTATWTIYLDLEDQVWTAQGYMTGEDYSTFTLVNPVSLEITPVDELTRTSIVALYDGTSWPPAADYTFPQSNWVRWSVDLFNINSQQTASRLYTLIPVSGTGAPGTSYLQTNFGYDEINHRNKVVTPAGTITRTVFDARNNPTGTWVGTNDTGASNTDPTGGGTAPNNMLPVVANVYDGGAGGLDNNLTQTTRPVDGTTGNDRITNFDYDFRGNRTLVTGPLNFCKQLFYDNMNRVWAVDRYDTSTSGALLARRHILFDVLGRVFRTKVYAVSSGTAGAALVSNTWFDPAGNKLKDMPAGSSGWTKFVYDAIARQIWSYVGYSTETENWDQAGNLSVSIVFEQTQTWFDDASNVVETDFYQRFHTASATITGALAGPSSSTVPARISFTAMYPDGIGRTVNTANYGTNGDADSFSRSPTAPTASSATVLVTIVIFNDRGEPYQTVDPKGQVNQTTLDNAARKTQFIQNLTSGAGPDQNITTNWTFDTGGHVSGLHAINADTGEQITAYSFGVTVAGGSTINSNDVLRVTTMSDGGATVKEVNRQGEVILVTDARGVVRQLSRDLLGRPTLDAVVTLPDSVDGAVMAIGLSYEVRGIVEKITSYAAASGPGSTVVNEVQNAYNDFWQLGTQWQEHTGAVNTSTSLKVQYAFADGTGNSSRPTGVTYPSTAALTLGYGASGSPDDLLSRVSSLKLGSDTVATYNFLGVGTPVIVEYPDPDIAYTLATGSGAGLYAGLDIFGRVINCLWQQTVGDVTTALASLGYGYDYASNRQWRQDNVAESLGKYFDEFYGLDGVYRLTGLARGQLTGTPPTGVTGQTFGEGWTLDPTGNWNEYQQLSDASTVTLDQTRTASAVNEITALTNTTGGAWAQPGYDAAGNMTTMPQPNSPGNPYASTFDAWQRMRFLYDMSTGSPVQVQENQYDGRNFRVRRIIPTESGTETRDFYQNDSWQVLQEYVSGYVDRQYVWGLRYIDDLVLRDRSVASPGALNERHYALQDDNWNVVAIYNAGTSAIDQRFAYSAYGILLPLNPDFTAYSGTDYDWTVLYTGRELYISTGLMNYRRRYYAPILGLFLTRDPIRYDAGDANLVRYLLGNPIRFSDPTGLKKCCVAYFDAPEGVIKPEFRQEQLGGFWLPSGFFEAPFQVSLGFKDDDGDCCASCCEYRQFVAGHWNRGNETIRQAFRKGYVFPELSEDTLTEDFSYHQGRLLRYGDPWMPDNPLSHYGHLETSGHQYGVFRALDAPTVNVDHEGLDKLGSVGIHLSFLAAVVDICAYEAANLQSPDPFSPQTYSQWAPYVKEQSFFAVEGTLDAASVTWKVGAVKK